MSVEYVHVIQAHLVTSVSPSIYTKTESCSEICSEYKTIIFYKPSWTLQKAGSDFHWHWITYQSGTCVPSITSEASDKITVVLVLYKWLIPRVKHQAHLGACLAPGSDEVTRDTKFNTTDGDFCW